MNSWGIHWFRRDLRIAGNAALRANLLKNQGRVVAVFCFDRKFLSRTDFSHNRFQFFLKTLQALRQEFQSLGGDLLVLDEGPEEAFNRIKTILQMTHASAPAMVSWGRDYEPFARVRDEKIKAVCESWGVEVHTERDHLLIEPHEITSGQGQPYQVYTPFAKKWFELLSTKEIQERIAIQKAGLSYLDLRAKGKIQKLFHLSWKDLLKEQTPKDVCDDFLAENQRRVTISVPDAGGALAWQRVQSWTGSLPKYGETRDIPGEDGTSKISMFLKNGSFTVPQLIAAYGLDQSRISSGSGETKYLKELIWREFYYHILWHHPRVEKEAFQRKYCDLNWDNNEDYFQMWKVGKTGFPIVDAGMRQLLTTGWMHNRVRMIVASFLTKDLLIDWRWGEQWFMEQLLDGDLAPNNGGWQWAASTGCDAQPYFRIFNPELQSKRFDPDGLYIKSFVPELAHVSSKEIHNPSPALRKAAGYPAPIVGHAKQKIRAMMMYKR